MEGGGVEGKGGVIERWMPACDVRLLLYSTVDIPEVMEHELARRPPMPLEEDQKLGFPSDPTCDQGLSLMKWSMAHWAAVLTAWIQADMLPTWSQVVLESCWCDWEE